MAKYNLLCTCGRQLEDLEYYENQVGCPVCDMPPEAEMKIYEFHCWVDGCDGVGNSFNCVKSAAPGMGYHCPKCNNDLTEWKRRRGVMM